MKKHTKRFNSTNSNKLKKETFKAVLHCAISRATCLARTIFCTNMFCANMFCMNHCMQCNTAVREEYFYALIPFNNSTGIGVIWLTSSSKNKEAATEEHKWSNEGS